MNYGMLLMKKKVKMNKQRILIVGLEEGDVVKIKEGLGFEYLFIHSDLVPRVKLIKGTLFVESTTIPDKFLKVDKVVFHGIYDNDFDFINLLALWNGPCLPNATGMMDLRKRIPGLGRALKVSTFNQLERGMVINQDSYVSSGDTVAKWGIWHCGEDKAKFHYSSVSDRDTATFFIAYVKANLNQLIQVLPSAKSMRGICRAHINLSKINYFSQMSKIYIAFRCKNSDIRECETYVIG